MKKHIKYASYIIRHKWFVLIAGLRLRKEGLNISLWRLLVHDMSKLLPSEWFPYAWYFYATKEEKSKEYISVCGKYGISELAPHGAFKSDFFNIAWLKHIHRNPHHWQYWILREDSGNTIAMPMPDKYVNEMVADWMGAGRAITGKWEAREWYLANRDKMNICQSTTYIIETILGIEVDK